MERNNDPTNELTRSPWQWEWLGNAGNWGLLGENGITYDGPDTADGRLKAAAPELLAALKAFVDYYPFGINPYLDSARNDARALIAQVEGEAVNV